MSQNIPHLQQYGRQLLQQFPDIRQWRKVGMIPPHLAPHLLTLAAESRNVAIIEWIIDHLIPRDFMVHNIKTVYRELGESFEMGWHIDDCALIRHSTEREREPKQYTNMIDIIAGGKYGIYFTDNGNNDRPKYSFILYLDTIHRDFEGGIFEFADGTRIEPSKGLYIFFDSREVHQVHRVHAGRRRNVLIKFYGSFDTDATVDGE